MIDNASPTIWNTLSVTRTANSITFRFRLKTDLFAKACVT